MVKATPKIRSSLARRRKKFMELYNHKQREALFLNSNPKTTTTTTTTTNHNSDFVSVSPSSDHHLQQQQTTKNSNLKTQEKPHETPLTPLSSNKKRRSRSPNSIYATCSSSSLPYSPSSLSSSPAFFNSNSPLHTQFLRRTVSDPPIFFSESNAEENSNSKKMRKINQELKQSSPVCRNLMGQLLPPLPPQPSPKLLRRTVSDPVPLLSHNITTSKEKNEKEEKNQQIVKAEKLSGDWTMIKLKCGCGSDIKFLFCAAENKCYKLV